MSSSLYHKLDTLRKDIRLLVISPGGYEAPLQLDLVVVSLLDKPIYHALSYCWGDEKETEMINIGREELPVTTNVVHALRRIRSSHVSLCLWIDAVCINQRDTEERGHQVRMMVDVYSQAELVHVWLGEEFRPSFQTDVGDHRALGRAHQDQEVRDGIFVAEQLAAGIHLDLLVTIFQSSQSMVASAIHEKNDQDDKARLINAIDALVMLMGQPWWQRVWILQEVVLPPRDPILHFSGHTFPMSRIIDAGVNFINHSESCCRESWMHSLNIDVSDSHNRRSSHFFRTFLLRRHFGWAKDIRELKSQYQSQELSLFGALQVSRERQTSDPRDHFYGILGLVDGFYRTQVNVDYRETIDVAFSRLVRLLAIESGNLAHLQLAVGGYDDVEQHNRLNLPSWIINFAAPVLDTLDHRLFRTYGMDSYREHWENRIMDLAELFVYGKEIDTGIRHYKRETKEYNSSGHFKSDKFFEGEHAVWALSRWALEHQLFVGDPTKSIKFWRWLLYGLFKPDDTSPLRRTHPDDLNKLVQQYRDLTEPDSNSSLPSIGQDKGELPQSPHSVSELQVSDHSVVQSSHKNPLRGTLEILLRRGLTWFVTHKGYLGAATRSTLDEYRIFVLSGVPAPVLLLPVSNEEDQHRPSRRGKAYKFAGLCYIDGFMDGEAVSEDVEWDTIVLC